LHKINNEVRPPSGLLVFKASKPYLERLMPAEEQTGFGALKTGKIFIAGSSNRVVAIKHEQYQMQYQQ